MEDGDACVREGRPDFGELDRARRESMGCLNKGDGLVEVLETQHKRRRILQHNERDEQSAVGTQASCMQEAGAECQRPVAELRAAPDAP